MNSARTELADARRAVADTCERMGLPDHADYLRRAYVQSSPDETRRQLASVKHAAGMILKVATAFKISELATAALALESDASKAIVLCDRVIEERRQLAEQTKGDRPVLGNRHMNLSRNGDDRR